jgi:dTDP-4-amino-4,6-dideoxygalactose transaminase
MQWRIPLSDIDYGAEEAAALSSILESRWISMGPEAQAFEREFAEAIGVSHAVAVSSATAGLHLAFLALGLRAGDEIIQPAMNFVACANMTVATGAIPVFADIVALAEPTIAPAAVERLIGPRTRGVVAMHYGGNLSRMDELRALCDRHRLLLIEDACHAVGAPPEGRKAGTWGDVGVFSFFSNKNMATGEGGMVITKDAAVADRVRLLRSHGMTSLSWDRYSGHSAAYDVVGNGYNYRLDDIHAALGRAQLRKLADNNARRRAVLDRYRRNLVLGEEWLMPFADLIDVSAAHLMVLVAPCPEQRGLLAARLHAAKVQTSLHYPNAAEFAAFSRIEKTLLPLTQAFASRALTLPLYSHLGAADVEFISGIVNSVTSGPPP